MPAVAALDDAVASMPRLALFAACATARDAIYFLPTREWAERFSRWARSRAGGLPVLEVGSGDGFVTACLRRVAPSVEWLASDDGSWAERYPVRRERTSAPPEGMLLLPADEAVAKVKPGLVFWCWPPARPEPRAFSPGVPFVAFGDPRGCGMPAHGVPVPSLSAAARGRSDSAREKHTIAISA